MRLQCLLLIGLALEASAEKAAKGKQECSPAPLAKSLGTQQCMGLGPMKRMLGTAYAVQHFVAKVQQAAHVDHEFTTQVKTCKSIHRMHKTRTCLKDARQVRIEHSAVAGHVVQTNTGSLCAEGGHVVQPNKL
eukprot:217348-Pelagomonas_calceolata.AAC.4